MTDSAMHAAPKQGAYPFAADTSGKVAASLVAVAAAPACMGKQACRTATTIQPTCSVSGACLSAEPNQLSRGLCIVRRRGGSKAMTGWAVECNTAFPLPPPYMGKRHFDLIKLFFKIIH